MITRAVFRQIEAQLRDRARLVERAEERLRAARDRAYSLPGMSVGGDRVSQSRQPDRIGAKASAVVEAERALAEARKWRDLFAEMDRRYPPTGDGPGMIVALHYGSGCTMQAVADELRISRPTAFNRQREWLTEAAFLAIHRGLIAPP